MKSCFFSCLKNKEEDKMLIIDNITNENNNANLNHEKENFTTFKNDLEKTPFDINTTSKDTIKSKISTKFSSKYTTKDTTTDNYYKDDADQIDIKEKYSIKNDSARYMKQIKTEIKSINYSSKFKDKNLVINIPKNTSSSSNYNLVYFDHYFNFFNWNCLDSIVTPILGKPPDLFEKVIKEEVLILLIYLIFYLFSIAYHQLTPNISNE